MEERHQCPPKYFSWSGQMYFQPKRSEWEWTCRNSSYIAVVLTVRVLIMLFHCDSQSSIPPPKASKVAPEYTPSEQDAREMHVWHLSAAESWKGARV